MDARRKPWRLTFDPPTQSIDLAKDRPTPGGFGLRHEVGVREVQARLSRRPRARGAALVGRGSWAMALRALHTSTRILAMLDFAERLKLVDAFGDDEISE
jgi:hypothetical protein